MCFSVCPLPHWEPPLPTAEQEVPQCTPSALPLPPRGFGNAQRQLIPRKSSCPGGLPWLPTALAIPSARVILDSPLDAALRREEQFVFGVCFSLLTAVQMGITQGSSLDWKRLKMAQIGGLTLQDLISAWYQCHTAWLSQRTGQPCCLRQHSTLSPTPCRETLTLSPTAPGGTLAMGTEMYLHLHFVQTPGS